MKVQSGRIYVNKLTTRPIFIVGRATVPSGPHLTDAKTPLVVDGLEVFHSRCGNFYAEDGRILQYSPEKGHFLPAERTRRCLARDFGPLDQHSCRSVT